VFSCAGSQFFITTGKTAHLDGKHVCFGRVRKGKKVVTAMETFGSRSGTPHQEIRIAACGQVDRKGKSEEKDSE
jgi:cyclophilin family peptidyl-prolyl cis-trans isomerase